MKKELNLSLINGAFSPVEAIELLARMVQVKIRFHEDKIEKSQETEDIKMREMRIKQLQQNLEQLRHQVAGGNSLWKVNAEVLLEN